VLFLVAIGVGWMGIGSIVSTIDRDSGVASAAHATAAAAYNMRISQAQNCSASTEQTSASTQEIAASAQELARTAEQLRRSSRGSRSPTSDAGDVGAPPPR
jgi:methyl-accepting chemotaxis protein